MKKDTTEAPLKIPIDAKESELLEQFIEFQQFKAMMSKWQSDLPTDGKIYLLTQQLLR